MNLLLLEPNELDDQGFARLVDRRALHVRRVLKLHEGDTVRVGVVDGARGRAVIERVTADDIQLTCRLDEAPLPRPGIDLLLALPRPKVMRRLWAPLASLGVDTVVLTNAARVERNYFDTQWLQELHYRPRLLEGLEQAGDTRLPRVHLRRRFKPLVEDELDAMFPGRLRLLAHPDSGEPALTRERDRPALLAIGPEGGWVDFERDLLQQRGFRPFSLGPRILRSDVACIALISAVAHAPAP